MFNSNDGTERGQASRAAIRDAALNLFRNHGFEQTKMRDVAQAAGVALGAAYYYFASKDAIIQSYYENVQSLHEERVLEALRASKLNLRDRLGIAFHYKLDIVKHDQRLLGAIFRYTGEPDHPLSCLGPATQPVRQLHIALFAEILEGESLPEDLRKLLPTALWALHMAVLIFFIYDRSPEQARTRKLVDRVLDLLVGLLRITKSPLLKPLRGKLLALLHDVDLIPRQDQDKDQAPQSQSREESL